MKVLSILVASIVLAVSVGQASAAQHHQSRYHTRQTAYQARLVGAYAQAPDYDYRPVRGAGMDLGACAGVGRHDSACNRQNGNSNQ